MDTLLTPADGADNRTDGPVKAKENGASTNIAKDAWCPFVRPLVLSRTCRVEEISGQSEFCRILYVSRRVQHTRCVRDFISLNEQA